MTFDLLADLLDTQALRLATLGEWGVAWDDPDVGLDWGIEGMPILSPRDQNNPRLRDI